MEEIQTSEAYESSAPLSQAIRYGDTVYLSGAVPIDPETGTLVDGGVAEQTQQVLANLEAVLKEAGSSMEHVIRAGVYLTDMNAFSDMNEVYESYLSEPYPARTAVKAEMASPDIMVEIDFVAAVPE